MKIKLYILAFLLTFYIGLNAQTRYTKINAYTADKGLSSNHTYDTAQDSNGFIWIATDNGVNRFDGHGFHRYTVENGLPSNDVVQVFVDRSGRIWANCYMKPLAYFEPKFNRFFIVDNDPIFSNNLWIYKLNHRGNYDAFYKNVQIEIDGTPKVTRNGKGYTLSKKNTFLKRFFFRNNQLTIEIQENSKTTSKTFPAKLEHSYSFFFLQSIFALTKDNRFIRFKIDSNSFTVEEQTIALTKPIQHFSFSRYRVNVVYQDGSIDIIDGKTFRILNRLNSEANPNNAFIDKDRNIWITTVDDGVQLFKNSSFRTVNFDRNKGTELQSVKIDRTDIFSANYFGQVFQNGDLLIDLRNLITGKKNIRINDIIFTKGRRILISDHFIVRDEKKVIEPPTTLISAIKSSQKISDSLIILGTSNGLFSYNVLNDKISRISKYEQRILNLAVNEKGDIYFSNSNQIFHTNVKIDNPKVLPISRYFTDDFISGMQLVAPDLLWVSTYRGNLHLFKNLKLIASLNYKNGISNNIRTIKATDKAVWIGTHGQGLVKLDYRIANDRLRYNLSFFNSVNGLTSNTVNAIDLKKDSVAVATTQGISVIPANYLSKNINTVPVITQTRIDGHNAANDSVYILKKNQHNIALTISNVDFENAFSRIQYAVDEPKEWINLKENVLNLEVSSGKKDIFIRSLKRNQFAASETIKIRIIKEKYFYESYWFWLLMGGGIIGLVMFVRSRMAMQKQKVFYEKEIERQKLLQKERERISTDMHDDLGASITALRYQAEYLKRKMGENPLCEDVDELLGTSQQIHKSMREMLWNLNAENDNLGNFVEYIEKYATGFFAKSPIELNIEQQNVNHSTTVSSEARRNMFLCIKEALNNVLKHSEAQKLQLKMIQLPGKFQVFIIDDGIGISEDHKTGNGLRNMELRMTNVNGTFTIMNSQKGTQIFCEIPV